MNVLVLGCNSVLGSLFYMAWLCGDCNFTWCLACMLVWVDMGF